MTIKKIAKLANVSPGTVDRIIHNRGQVSKENIEKVNAIIKEHGYNRNIFASNLVLNKKYKFAVLILQNEKPGYWEAPVIGIRKAEEEFAKFGITIDYFFYKYDIENFNKIAGDVLKRDYDGLVFAPVFEKESVSFLTEYKKKNIPTVLIDTNVPEIKGVAFIGQDSYKSGYVAGKLVSYGVKKESNVLIFKITGKIESNTHKTIFDLQKTKGFYSYFKENTFLPKFNITEVSIKDYDKSSLTTQMFAGINSVFVLNSRVHIIAKFIKENNLKDIRVIGYDLLQPNLEYLNDGTIDFLINQKPEEQGFLAINYLYKKLVLKEELKDINYTSVEIIIKENYVNTIENNDTIEESAYLLTE
jgi:LacI family transcriptional regulator